MAFLGRAIGFSKKFLGASIKGANFLARNSGAINNAARQFSNFTNSPGVQGAATQIGVNPNVLRGAARGVQNFGSVLTAAPGIVSDLRAVGQGAATGLAPVRQSIASLYQQAQQRN